MPWGDKSFQCPRNSPIFRISPIRFFKTGKGQGLSAVGQGLVRFGVNLDHDAVSARHQRRFGHRRHQAAPARRVRRVHDHREVGKLP